MEVTFLQRENYELDGVKSISTYLKIKGYKVNVTIRPSYIKKNKPEYVCIYVVTKDHFWALNMAKLIKRISPTTRVILGGPHPTHYENILYNPGVDAICKGEGEKSLIEYIESEEKFPIIKGKSLTAKEIPIPDTNLYNTGNTELQLMCSRGCPYKCPFCINYSADTQLRVRSITSIENEIFINTVKRNITYISIQDDIFGIKKDWTIKMLKVLETFGIPFYVLLRCEFITDDMIKALKQAGCDKIGIGIESGNEYIRNTVLDKHLKLETIEKAVKILKDNNMEFHTFNMFCCPEETYEQAKETVKLNIKLAPHAAKSMIMQPYPGTKFFDERIIQKNLNIFKANIIYTKDTKRIERLQKLFMITVKYPKMYKYLDFLTKLPLTKLYDKISQFSWKNIYKR